MNLATISGMGRSCLALIRAGARCYLACAVDADADATEAAILAHPIASGWWLAATPEERAAALASRP